MERMQWELHAAQMWCVGTPHLSLFKRKPNQTNKTQQIRASSVPSLRSAWRRMPCNPRATWVRLAGSDPVSQEQPKAGVGEYERKAGTYIYHRYALTRAQELAGA